MQLKTILNRVEPFKSFVYGKATWVEGKRRPTLEVEVIARKNGRAICSGLRPPTAGLRPPAAAAVPVRTPLGDHRVLRVRPAAGELPGLRGDGGASALGQRKEPFDHQLPLVPGAGPSDCPGKRWPRSSTPPGEMCSSR